MVQINQNPEQKARDNIDAMLDAAGWKVQDKKRSISTRAWESPSANSRPTGALDQATRML
jgi:type I site-specific restriction endonuclease